MIQYNIFLFSVINVFHGHMWMIINGLYFGDCGCTIKNSDWSQVSDITVSEVSPLSVQ